MSIKIRVKVTEAEKAIIKRVGKIKKFLNNTANVVSKRPKLKMVVAQSVENTIRAQSFTKLKPATIKRKGNSLIFLGTKTEQMTKALFRGQGLLVGVTNNNTINIGFNKDTISGKKAAFHQRGAGRLPVRRILRRTILLSKDINKIAREYISDGLKEL